MLNPGVYDCRVVDAFWSASSKKNTPCICVKAEIDDLEGPVRLVGNVYLTDATLGTRDNPGFFIQQLRALGYSGTLSALHPEPGPLVGLTGKCMVEASDRGQLRIAQFGVSGAAHVAMELQRLEALDAKLGLGGGDDVPVGKKKPPEDGYPDGFIDEDGVPKF